MSDMTKSANPGNRELIDYVLRALSEIPDNETLDFIEADNNLEPFYMYDGVCHSIERGLMEVSVVTLHLRESVTIRRTYIMLATGLHLASEEPVRHV